MSERTTVLLASPYGQTGGGMGSIMTYLASMQSGPATRYQFKQVETRGGGHVLLSPYYVAVAAGQIASESIRGRLALVHLNLAEGGSVYRKAALLAVAKVAGSKVLLHLHAARIRQFHQSVNGAGKWLLRWMFQTADHTVVLGDVWRQWVIENFNVPPGKVSIVYNGVPTPRQAQRPKRTDKAFHLLFVGNLSERKGVSDLLHALAAPPLRERNVKLTLAGGGPLDHYQQLAECLGIADHTRFAGWLTQDGARDLMLSADALILPSYDEGLPLVILEALASGTPVICTPVGSVPEVLKDHETALLVMPGAQDDIVGAVLELIDNASLRASLALAGSRLYARVFTLEAFSHSITNLYSVVLADRPRPSAMWSKAQKVANDGGD